MFIDIFEKQKQQIRRRREKKQRRRRGRICQGEEKKESEVKTMLEHAYEREEGKKSKYIIFEI